MPVVAFLLGATVVAAVPSAAHANLLVGGDGPDALVGTAGADALYGAGGDDALDGAGGDDDLDGGPGADDIRGGAGPNDAVTYGASDGVTVTLDGRANDGAPGEGDNVRDDVEHVYGGPGGDSLTGNSVTNTLDGGGGADRLTGGRGLDFLYGGPGDDTIDARDGRSDVVDCGAGRDRAVVDATDTVTGCEQRGTEPGVIPARRATGTVVNFWSWSKTTTTLDRLEIHDLTPADVVITVTCRGRGCPFTRRTFQGPRRIVLTRAFARRPLRVGTTIEIRIAAPDALGKFVRYTIRSLRRPATHRACLSPGGSRPVKCG